MILEGSDYFIHRLPFANRANGAAIIPNDDGTFDIYLNTLCDDDRLLRELRHELAHLDNDHFYSDDDITSEADKKIDSRFEKIVLTHALTHDVSHDD